MAVSYKKLFHMMIEKEMTNAELQQKAGFSANIITRLKRNGYISLESIENICRVMDCGVDDILEFVPDDARRVHFQDYICSKRSPYAGKYGKRLSSFHR
jgi:putative transcriptional regulator